MSALVKGIAGGGGNLTITNGILKEYYAQTGEIPAGTFVEMADGIDGYIGTETQLQYQTLYVTDAFHLYDNVFLILKYYQNYLRISGTIVKVNNDGSLTIGEQQIIYDTTSTVGIIGIKCVNLSGNEYALFGIGFNSSKLNVLRISIDDFTITYNSYNTDVTAKLYSSRAFHCEKLEDNKILLAYQTYNNSTISVMVTTFTSSRFTNGTIKTTSTSSDHSAGLFKLSDNKYLLAHGSYYLVVITISGTTVTFGSQIHTTNSADGRYGREFGLIQISSTRYFYMYGGAYNAPRPLYAVFIDISGTTITVVNEVTMPTYEDSYLNIQFYGDYFFYNGSLYKYTLTESNIAYEKMFDFSDFKDIRELYEIQQNKLMLFYRKSLSSNTGGTYSNVVDLTKAIPCITPATSSTNMVGFTKDRVTPEIKGKSWFFNG